MKVGVFIGRCQPLHDGHRYILKQMQREVDTVVVLLGSANSSRTIKNPFSFNERKHAIQTEFPDAVVFPLNDYLYNDSQWLSDVHHVLRNYNEHDVTLYGHTKQGNDYLKWFPTYPYVEVTSNIDVTATTIRQSLFEMGKMPESAQADFDFYAKEKELFASYPFPETLQFNCADALVMRQPYAGSVNGNDNQLLSEVLLVKRKFAPGANTWALPGGFKNQNETFFQCAKRELLEETGLEVKEVSPATEDAIDFMIGELLFDSPKRAQGIPRITQCVLFQALDREFDPKIQAADDASEVQWFTLTEILNEIDMFHDHRDIISSMFGEYATPAHLNAKYTY